MEEVRWQKRQGARASVVGCVGIQEGRRVGGCWVLLVPGDELTNLSGGGRCSEETDRVGGERERVA